MPSTQTVGATGSVITPVLSTVKSIYITLTMMGLLVCVTGCVAAKLDSTGKRVSAPAESYQYWIATSLDKVLKTDSIGSARTANLKAAKNEHEAFQIVLRPTAAMSGTTISTSSLTGTAGTIAASNVKVYLPWYINLPYYKRDVPDPLPPYSSPFNLAAGQTQPLWVDVYVPRTTAAGDYKGSINISTTGGSTMRVPYTLHVYKFTLPNEQKFQVLVDFYDYYMAPKEGVTWGSAEDKALWKKYYEMLLDHGMSMPTYPTDDYFSAETTAYMKDPRVSVVRIPYDANSTKQAQYFNQVKANGQWGKHVLDAVDEATSREQYEQVKVRANYYHSIDPTAKVLTTYYTATPSWAAPNHITDLLAGYTGVWCPMLGDAYEVDRLAVRRAAGDRVWAYIATNPDGVSPNYFLQDPAISHRIITWTCYLYDAMGWLYWHSNYWADVQDPWTDICTGKKIDPRLYGEGSLIYPGKLHTGVAGPVSSIRMEVWRDGVEDHKYFMLLQQKIGRAATLNYVKQVAQGWKVYTQNKDLFYSTRDQIAKKIEGS
ncbi:MAG: glycoside hydrolase domain-containing protein [Armatimonadota bacterium]